MLSPTLLLSLHVSQVVCGLLQINLRAHANMDIVRILRMEDLAAKVDSILATNDLVFCYFLCSSTPVPGQE